MILLTIYCLAYKKIFDAIKIEKKDWFLGGRVSTKEDFVIVLFMLLYNGFHWFYFIGINYTLIEFIEPMYTSLWIITLLITMFIPYSFFCFFRKKIYLKQISKYESFPKWKKIVTEIGAYIFLFSPLMIVIYNVFF